MADPILAAVDVGTNSVHMVVARVGDGGRMEILEREKEMVRLGRSGGDMKRLDPDAIDRGVAALARCREVADAHGAELRAVATSAVREAENRKEFLGRAREEAGVEVEIVSGFEEARLIHLGVLQALPVYDRRMLLCDIGGGSTEVVVGERGDVLASRSFRLGAIRLTQRFFADGAVNPRSLDRCRAHAASMMAGFAPEVLGLGFEVAVGSSGTIETAVAVSRAGNGSEPVTRTLNGLTITAAQVADVVERVAEAPDPGRLSGVDARRADILLAGVVILEQFVQCFGVDELVFSDFALREGVLLDQSRRRSGATLHHLQDLRRRSVLNLVELTDERPEHSAEIARHALELFDELAPLLGLDAAARELLEAAARLCNVGVFISHSGHHLHSYYVIRNSEHLTGFTDREIEIVALVARYHRKSGPKSKHAEWAALDEEDQELVRSLAAVLRVAIGLDRSYGRRVEGVVVSWDDETVRIDLRPVEGTSIELEVHAVDQRTSLLADVVDRRIVVGPLGPGS